MQAPRIFAGVGFLKVEKSHNFRTALTCLVQRLKGKKGRGNYDIIGFFFPLRWRAGIARQSPRRGLGGAGGWAASSFCFAFFENLDSSSTVWNRLYLSNWLNVAIGAMFYCITWKTKTPGKKSLHSAMLHIQILDSCQSLYLLNYTYAQLLYKIMHFWSVGLCVSPPPPPLLQYNYCVLYLVKLLSFLMWAIQQGSPNLGCRPP